MSIRILSVNIALTLAITLNAKASPTVAPSMTQGGPESVSKSRNQLVLGTAGMVVSDDPIASEWGAEILRKGGNAIDAAVATAFAMAVTRPHYASLGGGGFMIYCPRSENSKPSLCQALDYREKAPSLATRNMFIHNGKSDIRESQNGALASGIPGTPAGLLTALKKWGTFSREKLLSRPVTLAKKGYRFSTHTENAALDRWDAMNDSAKKIFGCSDKPNEIPQKPCAPGTLIRQPDLAKVLEAISRSGEKGFYDGAVAKKMIDGIQRSKGIMTLEDLKMYSPRFRTPLRTEYKGFEIITMPPPSSGGAILIQLLGYAERAEKTEAFQRGYGSADLIHTLIHGMSLAFMDRALYLGDPDFVEIPLERLLSPSYLDQRWKTFDLDRQTIPKNAAPFAKEPQYTTHFAVIDRDGNTVSVTTTVNDNFGSGFVPPGTGIVMNNEMDDFSTQPGVPNLFGLVGGEANSIQGGKRPLSSMTPTVVRDLKGNAVIAIGAAGGPRIITSVFLSLFNRLQFNMSLIDAVSAPRFHQQWKPLEVNLERFGFSPETRAILEKKGYLLKEVPGLGKVHAIEKLADGRTSGAPDPRGEGAAVAE